MSDDKGLRGRVTRQGEEAIGKLAQELLDNPVVSRALSAAFETRRAGDARAGGSRWARSTCRRPATSSA